MAKAKKKKASKKKKAVKKSKAVKKAAKKKPAKAKGGVYIRVKSNILGEAPKEFEFYLSDGRRLKNVFELVDALEDMSSDLFEEHVNEMKNDFSNWIKDVFKEHDVAKEIQRMKDRIEMQKILMRKLIEAAKKSK